MRKSAGFTLLEILVAIAIFGLMAAMAYGGLGAVIQTRDQLDGAQLRLAAMQKAFYRLQADLESAQNRPIRDAFSTELASLTYLETQGLEFTRGGLRNPIGLPRSSLERVAYVVAENKETRKNELRRRRWPVLDRANDTAFAETVLLEDVEGVEWRFLNDADEWQTQWPPISGDPAASAGLPRAVELTLTTKDYGELRYLFGLTAAVEAQETPPPPPPPS
ncbi:MAG: type II secretion system minor pseudopilin GspJ [Nevskiales bacterium]